jgi:excisionase family DNA binding protein
MQNNLADAADRQRQIAEQAERAEAEARLNKMLEIAGLLGRSTFRPKEVANLLGTSLTSVYRMIGSGEIDAIYPRSSIRIDFSSLLKFVINKKES